MTVNGSTTSSWRPAVPCPRDDLGLTPAARPRTAEQVREAEIAALVAAYSAGNAQLAAGHQVLVSACEAVIGTYRAAESAIDRVRTFVAIGSAAEARGAHQAVVDRHADDGPEDRRRVLAWARWAFWPVVLLSGVFEGVYLAKIFQQLLNVGPGSFLYWTSYVPAVGLTVCLLVVGTMLAQAVFRHRSRVERRLERGERGLRGVLRRLRTRHRDRDEHAQRRPDDLPWPVWTLPVVFGIAVFAMLGSWAQIRAMLASVDNALLAPYEPYTAGMLVLLAAGVVVVKFLAHNPYADSAKAAAKQVKQAQATAEPLVEAARELTTTHYRSWLDLQARLAGAEASAKQSVENAVIHLREERSRTGAASPIDPPGQAVTSDDPSVVVATDTGVADLRLDFTVYAHSRAVADHYGPGKLHRRLKQATGALHGQFQLDRVTDPDDVEEPTG
ncbi:hypothetical protein AB0K14_11630 [Actinosynnema sp. NPDC050801]|uniref:hypothetical protein n=1 Tax=unclassified Actinosynnema TaxID=2637065 RepID=UPI0033D59206